MRTSANSVFAESYHPTNAFGASQTRGTLGVMLVNDKKEQKT